LKWTDARSAGRVRSMTTWEKFGTFKMDVGGETATGCVARTWEEDGSMLSSA
jgi:hypothetical protein